MNRLEHLDSINTFESFKGTLPPKAEYPCLLEGELSVRAALEGAYRTVALVLVDEHKKEKRDRKTIAFLAYLKKTGVPFTIAPREHIDRLVLEHDPSHAGHTHGGLVALASERRYPAVEELLGDAAPGDYWVCLDGVEDPFNFGYSIRAFYAMGCKGILLPGRNWETAAAVMARASAGASERIPMAFLPSDDEKTVELFEKNGVHIVCSALAKRSIPLYAFAPEAPFVLFIGGEKRGISPLFMEKAQTVVHIPYARENVRYSLPTNSVSAMFAAHLGALRLQKPEKPRLS